MFVAVDYGNSCRNCFSVSTRKASIKATFVWPIHVRVFLTELTSKNSLQKRRRLVQSHTCVLFASALVL